MSGYDPETLDTLRKALDETWNLISEEREGCRTIKDPVPSST
jgi:hypothetical protein